MAITDKIKEMYALRAKEAFEHGKNYRDYSWLEPVLNDILAAGANELADSFARWCIENKHYDIAIQAYHKSANLAGLLSLGKNLFSDVKEAVLHVSQASSSAEESGEGLLSYEMRKKNTLGLLYHAADALAIAGTQEAKQLIKEIADFALGQDADLAFFALEKGGYLELLSEFGDKAIVDGQLEKALDLFEKARQKDKLALVGDLFVAKCDYSKAEKAYVKAGNDGKAHSLIARLSGKESLSSEDFDLLIRLCKSAHQAIPADKIDQLYSNAISTKDTAVLLQAIDVLAEIKDSERLEKIGDACASVNSYAYALSAYQKASEVKKMNS